MVGALAEKYADAIPWLIVAGAVLAAWLVLFTIVARATMPRLPEWAPRPSREIDGARTTSP